MMKHLANLVNWEWFKVQRRWMPWILLAILLAFSQLFVWGNFFEYRGGQGPSGGFTVGGSETRGQPVHVSCEDLRSRRVPPELPPGILEDFQQRCQELAKVKGQTYAAFTLPGSISSALVLSQDIGVILIAILTASVLGTEYAWGTLRPILARGTGRWQYLTSKLALMALLALGAMIVVAVATTMSSLLAGALAEAPPAREVSAAWTEAGTAVAKAWVGLLPYIALAALITVVFSSSVAGIALALVYNFAEEILVAILLNVFEGFDTVADFLLGRNITAWMLSDTQDQARVILGGIFGEFPGAGHAFLVMAAYTIVLGGLAFWVFLRRDVRVGSGG